MKQPAFDTFRNDRFLRLRFRVFVEGAITHDETVTVDSEDGEAIHRLARSHAARSGGKPLVIEIEFLDEPNQFARFVRFGTDPSRMVAPVAFDPRRPPGGKTPRPS